ncbi:MAG: ATP-binding protein, partial [Fluviicola sp.]
MQKTPLQFKISSALKNIIGSDLISDDFIAVFELVKNAYDAHASKVEITFENIYSDNSKILIKDNGKGMNYDDLINKWLFVAYSAKKEGTEEDSYDYRDKIKVKRAYAGAKGIGRFSCDRLGGELYLETIKDEPNAKVETLLTQWDKFEGDIKEEFVNISVLHETFSESNYNIKQGTTLEITKLKSVWNREKILDLKDSLARLINPNIIDNKDNFQIKIIAEEELLRDEDQKNKNANQVNHDKSPLDKEQVDYFRIVNVPKIKNLVFETLNIKTTKITSKIFGENFKQIETSLFEGGKLVYKIIEENKYPNLHNIECELYYLNRSAKVNFFKKMGVHSVEYGHIFVYKNGLRIYPYGDRNEDPLRMDNRKSQGHSRYIGTRESMGYIYINEPNDELRETSSRGDGLIKSKTYFELVEWFYDNLKRLEKYIIDITDWGNELSNEDYIKLDNLNQKKAIEDLIFNLTKSKGIISFEVSPEIFEIIDKKQEKSTKNSLTKIKKQLESNNYDKDAIVESISKIEKNLDDLKKNSEEATEEALEKGIKNEELTIEIEKKNEQLSIRNSIDSQDIENVTNLHHQVFVVSDTISSILDEMHNMISLGEGISEDELKQFIDELTLENSKVESLSRFGMRAIFEDFNSVKENSLPDFIKDYVEKISNYFKNNKVDVVFNQLTNKDFTTRFRP